MEWQPIATAPSETPVLVFCPGNHSDEWIMMAERDERRGLWSIFVDGQIIEPTHWMPLPSPPNSPP
jgi:hypothetical protein